MGGCLHQVQKNLSTREGLCYSAAKTAVEQNAKLIITNDAKIAMDIGRFRSPCPILVALGMEAQDFARRFAIRRGISAVIMDEKLKKKADLVSKK